MKKKLLLFGLLTILYSCAPSRLVKPLSKGQQQLGINLGGPLIKFGTAVIPIPYTSVSYAKGITEFTTVFGALHTTSLLFGVVQTELGVLRNLLPEKEFMPGLSTSVAANMAIDFQANYKFWPQLDLNLYKTYSSHKHFIYLGTSNWFELASKRAFNEPQPNHWFLSPQIGNTFCSEKWTYTLELKYMGGSIYRLPNVVEYVGVGDKGAFGLYFNVARRF